MTITVGDHVRVNATGEILVVDGKEAGGVLCLSKYGNMAGSVVIHTDRVYASEVDVTKVEARVEWVDATE